MATPYHVKIAPAAIKQLRELNPKQQKTVFKFIEALAINPRPPGVRKIEGMTGLYCEDIHYLRIIFKIEEQEVLVLLVK